MGQHGALDNVANGVDARSLGLEVAVDRDPAKLVSLETDRLRTMKLRHIGVACRQDLEYDVERRGTAQLVWLT